MSEFRLEDAEYHLADLVKRADYDEEVVYIMRRGQRVAAIVPAEMAEAIEAAEDRADLEAARAAIAEGGEPIPLEDILARIDQ